MDGSRRCRFLLPASVSDHSVNGLKFPFNLHCTPLYDNLKAGKNLWLLSTGTGLAPFLSRVLAFICIAFVPVHVIRNANSMWSSAG